MADNFIATTLPYLRPEERPDVMNESSAKVYALIPIEKYNFLKEMSAKDLSSSAFG